MMVYLAGSISGQMVPFWKEYWKLEEEDFASREERLRVATLNYLPDDHAELIDTLDYSQLADWESLPLLESYYSLSHDGWQHRMIQDMNRENFMLDSGAFTFIQEKDKGQVNWDGYLNDYAKFICDFDIDFFFELDVDVRVGLERVEVFRDKLEQITGKPCIPVFHRNREKDYWFKMLDEYDYVALGGIAIKDIKPNELDIFHWFTKTAHQHDTKIHALGRMDSDSMKKYDFDSADATYWLYGNIHGYLDVFDGNGITKVDRPSKSHRLKSRAASLLNYLEWIKFSKYARRYL